jgi:hypothetical protein
VLPAYSVPSKPSATLPSHQLTIWPVAGLIVGKKRQIVRRLREIRARSVRSL